MCLSKYLSMFLGSASVHKEAVTGPSVPGLPGTSDGAGVATGNL